MQTFLVVFPLVTGKNAMFLYQIDKHDPMKEITRRLLENPIFKHNPIERKHFNSVTLQDSISNFVTELDSPDAGLLAVL